MVRLSSVDVASALSNKLRAETVEKDHTYFYIYNDLGERLAQTKISHGRAHTLSDSLVSQMARQLRLDSAASLASLVRCTLERDEALEMMTRNPAGPGRFRR